MVGVGGGVNSREALAAAHEVEQRLPPGGRRRRVVRIVQERAGGAGEEDRVVLLQVLLVDVGGIVGDGRRPGAGLLAQLFDRRPASGIDECTKPAALPSTSTLRACFGLAGAVAGSAAIIASTCCGCGV